MNNPPKILLLEDTDDIREPLKTLFEREGYEVMAYGSGIDAVLAFLGDMKEGRCFDVLLFDCALPSFDGFTVAQMIRLAESTQTTCHKARLIFFTGKTRTVEDGHLLSGLKYDAYLEKPLDFKELSALIRGWIFEGVE